MKKALPIFLIALGIFIIYDRYSSKPMITFIGDGTKFIIGIALIIVGAILLNKMIK